MKAADAFGVVVRTAGLVAVLYGMYSIAEGLVTTGSFASLAGSIPSPGGAMIQVTGTPLVVGLIFGMAAILCGVTLLRSAEVIVRFAYPPSWGIEILPPGLRGSEVPRPQP